MAEQWRNVNDCYQVSDEGRVRGLPRTARRGCPIPGRMLRPTPIGDYLYVKLARDGTYQRRAVHDLVLTAFVGPRPPGKTHTRHLDGDTRNNQLQNLMWATPKENAEDRRRHGTDFIGEKNPNACTTIAQVREVRSLLASGMGSTSVARHLGMSVSIVKKIKRGECWSEVE